MLQCSFKEKYCEIAKKKPTENKKKLTLFNYFNKP